MLANLIASFFNKPSEVVDSASVLGQEILADLDSSISVSVLASHDVLIEGSKYLGLQDGESGEILAQLVYLSPRVYRLKRD